MKRAVCLLLLTAVLFTVGCNNFEKVNTEIDENVTESESIIATTETYMSDSRFDVTDNLPETDFGGMSYTIVTDTYQEKYYSVENENGDIINDAIYTRNFNVSERFNVEIIVMAFPYPSASDYMTKTLLAAEDTFNINAMQAINGGILVLSDLFLNWNNIPNIDFTQPWWSASTVKDLEYNGYIGLAIGDLALGAMTNTYCMYYDKVQANNYGLVDMYAIVNDGLWTVDRLFESVKNIYNDTNGNGERDIEDYYGLATPIRSDVNAYLWAFENPIFKRNSSGELEFVYKTEKLSSIIEKIYDLCYNNIGVFTKKGYNNPNETIQEMSRDMFITGNTLFANGYLEMAVTHFREIESDFGIIPYPKWDEAQKRYLTMADGNFAGLSVPKTITNYDLTGIITEALCAETWKIVYPAYYENALKVKFTRDNESVAMLDLILDGRVFDFGYVYDGLKGASFNIQRLIGTKSKDFESYYAKNESSITKQYNSVLEYFKTKTQ